MARTSGERYEDYTRWQDQNKADLIASFAERQIMVLEGDVASPMMKLSKTRVDTMLALSELPGNPCYICGKTDKDKPTCFTGERYCSEDHRKSIVKLLDTKE